MQTFWSNAILKIERKTMVSIGSQIKITGFPIWSPVIFHIFFFPSTLKKTSMLYVHVEHPGFRKTVIYFFLAFLAMTVCPQVNLLKFCSIWFLFTSVCCRWKIVLPCTHHQCWPVPDAAVPLAGQHVGIVTQWQTMEPGKEEEPPNSLFTDNGNN